MLPSRNFPSPDAFVADFMATLTPGVIPRAEFIKWDSINKKVSGLRPHLEFYSELSRRIEEGADFSHELVGSLLASDQPIELVKCAFELLGHTNPDFVTKQDDFAIQTIAEKIAIGDEHQAREFAELLKEVGFPKLLTKNALEDLLFGIQIGLETHRRKNVGGDAFRRQIEELLRNLASGLSETGRDIEIKPEEIIRYGTGLSKKVDFAILWRGRTRFGIEVNFYTVSGSKPTEIKRSYSELLAGLRKIGVELIWITDGKGYRTMQRSLRDAYVILPNIYNRNQASRHLQTDLQEALV